MASAAGPYVAFSFVFPSALVSPCGAQAGVHEASEPLSSPFSFIADRPAKRPTYKAEFVCVNCGVTSTPQARAGPAGPATLCNRFVASAWPYLRQHASPKSRCGLALRKEERRRTRCKRRMAVDTLLDDGAHGKLMADCEFTWHNAVTQRRCISVSVLWL